MKDAVRPVFLFYDPTKPTSIFVKSDRKDQMRIRDLPLNELDYPLHDRG